MRLLGLSLFLFLLVGCREQRLEAGAAVTVPLVQADSLGVVGDSDQLEWFYWELDRTGTRDTLTLRDDEGQAFRAPIFVIANLVDKALHTADASFRVSVFNPNPRVLYAGCTFFLLIGMGLLAVGLARYRRRFLAEQEQRLLLAEAHRRLGESREEERLRIARDLHDGPVQDLYALALQSSISARRPSAVPTADVSAEVQRVIQELRGISEDLRPPALGPFGFSVALRDFARRFRHQYPDIQVELDLAEDGQLLPEPMRLVLFRVAQEAMNNAAKHAQCTHLTITFRILDDRCSLEVMDDGVGFVDTPSPAPSDASGGFGLIGMRERAASVVGALEIDGTDGTRVSLTLPLARTEMA